MRECFSGDWWSELDAAKRGYLDRIGRSMRALTTRRIPPGPVFTNLF